MPTATKEPTKRTATSAAASHASAGRYIEAIGRRKTAIARVRLTKGDGKFLVNDKAAKEYFDLPRLITAALKPLVDLKLSDMYDVSAHVSGGGIHAQAEAIRLGIARVLAEQEPERK